MIRRPPRSTHCISSAASDVYKRQRNAIGGTFDALPPKKESDEDRNGLGATRYADVIDVMRKSTL